MSLGDVAGPPCILRLEPHRILASASELRVPGKISLKKNNKLWPNEGAWLIVVAGMVKGDGLHPATGGHCYTTMVW